MIVRESDDLALYNWVQDQNLARQYDLLANCVEIGVHRGAEAFDKYTLWALNYAAVSNICELGGRFREEPIYVGSHIPPHYKDVPNLMDRFVSFIHENWGFSADPTTLAAYVLWRINWIHPFIEGNGRTARAACYLVLCLKHGGLLPGRKIVPERIIENREPYYEALKAADRAWSEGHFDVTELSAYLQTLLKQQLADD
ncbi:MAG: Fic family protein [Nitratireductor sp.]|nr:Fic family protein [Nitratireductor sp.]